MSDPVVLMMEKISVLKALTSRVLPGLGDGRKALRDSLSEGGLVAYNQCIYDMHICMCIYICVCIYIIYNNVHRMY